MPTPNDKYRKLPAKCRKCHACILMWDFTTSKCDGCDGRKEVDELDDKELGEHSSTPLGESVLKTFTKLQDEDCEFRKFYYDGPLCCLKRETKDPHCNDNCPALEGGKLKCKPVKSLCDYCSSNPKVKPAPQ